MNDNIETLYKDLSFALTEKRLGDLATRIISAWRDKEYALLRTAASVLMDTPVDEIPDTALFVRVIKHCHPDRTASLRKEAETAFHAGDTETLVRLGRLFHVEKAAVSTTVRKPPVYQPEPEVYEAEPGFHVFGEDYDYDDYLAEDEENWMEEEEVSFLSAIREELIGNLDFTLSPADLAQLDGELDLSARELTELKGLEYCRHISILNLSGNHLDRISEIASLDYLRELYLEGNDISDLSPLIGLAILEIVDVSNNDIEDISPLLRLPELKFADLRGNPLKNHSGIIKKLEAHGAAILV